MATIDNLIDYGGNAALGLGSNSDVPAIGKNEDLSVVNNTIRDVMMLNNDKNVRLYQQKINDRDKLNQLIANNEVAVGKIEPKDQPIYDEAKKRAQDAFVKWGGNFNDTNGYRQYQDAVQGLKDVATTGQSRAVELAKLRAEGAQLTLDKDKEEFKSFYDKQASKPFWEPITPHQKLHDYSADGLTSSVLGTNGGLVDETGAPITQPTQTAGKVTTKIVNGKPVTTTTQTTTPVKGASASGISVNSQGQLTPFSAPTTKYYDWNTMRRNAQNAFIDGGEGYQNEQQHFQAFQDWLNNPAIDNITKTQAIDSMNNRLTKEYVEQTGGKFGTPPEIKIVTDQNGTKHIGNSVADFAAATVLAGINGAYKITQPVQFNKEVGEYLNTREKNHADAIYKGIMAANSTKRANAYVSKVGQQLKNLKSQAERDAVGDDLWYRNLKVQPELIGQGDGKTFIKGINADNSLPLFTFKDGKPTQMIPFGATPIGKDGKPIDTSASDYNASKNPVVSYKGGYYKPQYIVGGKVSSMSELQNEYNDFVSNANNAYKKSQDPALKWDGSISDWLKEKIQRKQVDVKFRGENNTVTDAGLNNSALQFLNNANQKKDQVGAFDEGPDDNTVDQAQE